MRTLAIMRHAKSSWGDPGRADRDRPLAPRGREAAPRVAAHLAAGGFAPDLVLCSPAARTRETLERLGDLVAAAEVRIDEALYGAAADGVAQRLRELPDPARSVLLIGHNPACQQLVLDLAGAGTDRERVRARLPTAAVALLDVPAASWSDLAHGQATLTELVLPRELTAPPRRPRPG